jgi:hypothetical protein
MELTFSSALSFCSSCGKAFRPESHRQRVCSKGCGRRYVSGGVRFVGVDGEGLGDDPSRYVLLGVGDRQIENPTGLTHREIFPFLYDNRRRFGRGTAFVGFYLGYDFTQWFKSLPEDKAWWLLTQKGKAKRKHKVAGKEPHPVLCDGWQFDILGSKRFRIRPHPCDCEWPTCPHEKEPWMFICDVGGYWQTSFLNVIDPSKWTEPVVTPEEFRTILEGKNKRAVARLDDDMRRYNRLENESLSRAMASLDGGFTAAGVRLSPRQWFGPGQAAGNWLKGRAPSRADVKERVPGYFLDAARRSYFGGWFEILMHGKIPGTTYEYDINSAYPDVIRRLPCLLHGRYTKGTSLPNVGPRDVCYLYARVYASRNPSPSARRKRYTGPMPHRDSDGSILRPGITEGWFEYNELLASVKSGLCQRLVPGDVAEWVKYEPCDCPPPMREAEELYAERLRVGKDTPVGKADKLLNNSGYGKFAQSVGEPPFGNAVYASLITAGCRTQILKAIGSHPGGIRELTMVATDAVFFRSPHPGLTLGKGLGEWEETRRENLVQFKPGVYWDDETREQIREARKPKFKARGVNAEELAREIWRIDYRFDNPDTLRDKSGAYTLWPSVEFKTDFSMVTALQALQRHKWELAGTVHAAKGVQDSNPSIKRGKAYWDDEMGVLRTEIHWPGFDFGTGDYDCRSVPYRSSFGDDNPFSDEAREALGITPDGLVMDLFTALLKNKE